MDISSHILLIFIIFVIHLSAASQDILRHIYLIHDWMYRKISSKASNAYTAVFVGNQIQI